MISPTGKGIRSDSEGDGHYGAPRVDRIHNGVDYECDPGQEIVAPFNMKITRIAYPKRDMVMAGIAWKTVKSEGRMFYFTPDFEKVGDFVEVGEVIGIAQNVSKYYNLPNMKNHIHFRVDK